jgi:branched-chain amino acid transport system permease protein
MIRWYAGPTLYTVLGVVGLLGVAGPFLPLFVGTLLVSLMIWMALAYSLNLITGLTGYVNFGHVIFMGIGAYALGGASEAFALPPLVGVLLGAALGFVFALGIGSVTLRLRGVYFAIASLVLLLGTQYAVYEIPQLGGSGGLIFHLEFQPTAYYYTIWTILMLEVLLTYRITRGRIGYAVRALRADEEAAEAIGIDAARLKLVLFSLSGLFAGAAGAVYAWTTSGVFPTSNFGIPFTLRMLAMVIIGGMGTVVGPLLGSAIVIFLQYYMQTTLAEVDPKLVGLDLVAIGILVAVMALFLPKGIVGTVRKLIPSLKEFIE